MTQRCILFDGLAVITGGQVTRASAFLRRFRRYDSVSRLVVLRSEGNWIPNENGIEVVDVSLPRRKEVVDVSLSRWNFRAVRRMLWQNYLLPRFLKKFHADVYISFSHYVPVTMPHDVMTITGVTNFAPFSDLARQAEITLKGKLRLAILKRSILSSANRATRVIALSEAMRCKLIKSGIDTTKIVVIPNGVEVFEDSASNGQDSIRPYGVTADFLLYVSHFYRYKNFERLIKAYSGLPPALRERFALVLVGEPHDRRYFCEIQALIDALKLRSRISVIPGLPLKDLTKFYRTAGLFIFASLVENSPNILLEAMACGAPVLASQVEPMSEFGKEAVRYVDTLSIESMTKEIEVLLNDPEMRKSLGMRARVQARSFTWDNFTSRVVGLYA